MPNNNIEHLRACENAILDIRETLLKLILDEYGAEFHHHWLMSVMAHPGDTVRMLKWFLDAEDED